MEEIKSISNILSIDPLEIIEFSEKQSFLNCNQSGNINTINNNDNFEGERVSFIQQIEELKKDEDLLMDELTSLKKIMEDLLKK